MAVTIGLICSKDGFGFTKVDHDTGVIEDDVLSVPPTKSDRGEQLDWLLEEAGRLFEGVSVVTVKHAVAGRFAADPQRYEVGAVVQVAAHRAKVACRLMTTEQVRAAMGLAKAKGAYESLLARPEIKIRSNAAKREQFVYALAAAKQS